MEFAQQKAVIAQLQDIFKDGGALAGYMRYTMGGSADYMDMFTIQEIVDLEDKTSEQDLLAAVDDEDGTWTYGLEYASERLGYTVAALQAIRLLAALGTREQEVFEGIDELHDNGEFTQRGEFMQELWDAMF